jgi:UDP-N-acetylglucosamine 4,6-dehydratase
MITKFALSLSTLGRAPKRAIVIAYDLTAMTLALWAAFSTRLGQPFLYPSAAVYAAAVGSFAIGLYALYWLRVYHLVLRYFDLRAVSSIFLGAVAASTAWVILAYFTLAEIRVEGVTIIVPRSIGFIYLGFLFFLLFVGRYAMTLLIGGVVRGRLLPRIGGGKSVVIYGANAVGISLADSMRSNREYALRAFVDDDPALHGQIAAGIPIYSPEALPDLVSAEGLEEVFLAMPKATRTQRLGAISRLTSLDLKVKTVPAPEEIASGRFTVSDVRPIDVNDLLRRAPVEPLTGLIQQAVEGHSILITGAGGSIGSEICRQIVYARPQRMVLFDHSEFSLYTIEQKLEDTLLELDESGRPEVVAVVGSMLNEHLVRDTLARHSIDTIYHAAAYKHVPLLEHNEVVGVENNVMGTLVLARAAVEAGLERFTMISTDKAVRPESVMGASKRTAELIVQALAVQPDCKTRFGIVRFGNVLDSSGSVVQRFRRQISQGGPITVTHADVTRYFMSIPEATQLVLQASAMANGGEVFVLDMGEPIRIEELARNMVALSGMTVRDEHNLSGDIEIVYVGLRPGEKLYEELFVGSDALETEHPRIKMAKERFLPLPVLMELIDELSANIAKADAVAVRQSMRQLVEPDQETLPASVTRLRRA